MKRETYLRHTSHRTGGELVDEGEGLLWLVGHDGDRLDWDEFSECKTVEE
jgi:hypothetical protein